MRSAGTRGRWLERSTVALLTCLACAAVAPAEDAGNDAATAAEFGPHPSLPAPTSTLIPTLHIAKAKPWQGDAHPVAAPGLTVRPLARGLKHPRWLYVLPNGDVLVAESDAPPKPDDAKGVSGEVHKLVMKHAGSGEDPSANRITLLRQSPSSTEAEQHVFLSNLNSPIGMALVDGTLYIADSDALLRVPYTVGATEVSASPTTLTDLPGGTINHHWTKSLLASPDGKYLYVGVGSNSNAGENGIDAEAERAAVWQIDRATGRHRVYASGLRNPCGLAWEPDTGVLWVSVNERDELGDHVPPDYMTGLRDGAFYGFPYSYYGQHVDTRVKPQDPAKVAAAVMPDYALGAHTASLGLAWSAHVKLTPAYVRGMFIGQHGSWNRKPRSGYKVIFVPFDHSGHPNGLPRDVLTGFLNADGDAQGRPVGLAIAADGALLVADDVGGTVWRVGRD